MVHRLALLLGGVGAAAVLALAMGAGGLLPAGPTAALGDSPIDTSDQMAQADPTLDTSDPTPVTTKTVVDTVYVEAAPKPAVIHINKPPRNPTPAAADGPRAGDRGDDRDDDERGDDHDDGGDDHDDGGDQHDGAEHDHGDEGDD